MGIYWPRKAYMSRSKEFIEEERPGMGGRWRGALGMPHKVCGKRARSGMLCFAEFG
jgi:hypothetical protein